MSVHSFLSPRALMGAAIVGAAGIFIYAQKCAQIYAEKKREKLRLKKLEAARQAEMMWDELEALRIEETLRRCQQKRKRKCKSKSVWSANKTAPAADSDGEQDFTDYQSVINYDDDGSLNGDLQALYYTTDTRHYTTDTRHNTADTRRHAKRAPKGTRGGGSRGGTRHYTTDTRHNTTDTRHNTADTRRHAKRASEGTRGGGSRGGTRHY